MVRIAGEQSQPHRPALWHTIGTLAAPKCHQAPTTAALPSHLCLHVVGVRVGVMLGLLIRWSTVRFLTRRRKGNSSSLSCHSAITSTMLVLRLFILLALRSGGQAQTFVSVVVDPIHLATVSPVSARLRTCICGPFAVACTCR